MTLALIRRVLIPSRDGGDALLGWWPEVFIGGQHPESYAIVMHPSSTSPPPPCSSSSSSSLSLPSSLLTTILL